MRLKGLDFIFRYLPPKDIGSPLYYETESAEIKRRIEFTKNEIRRLDAQYAVEKIITMLVIVIVDTISQAVFTNHTGT